MLYFYLSADIERLTITKLHIFTKCTEHAQYSQYTFGIFVGVVFEA